MFFFFEITIYTNVFAFDVYGRYLILGWRWKALTPMVGAPCQLDGFPPRFYEE